MTTGKHKKEKIPSWLWFALYYGMDKRQKWNPEKEELALYILKRLKETAEFRHWDISKIIHIEKHDSAKGYLVDADKLSTPPLA